MFIEKNKKKTLIMRTTNIFTNMYLFNVHENFKKVTRKKTKRYIQILIVINICNVQRKYAGQSALINFKV
jgi:hypothetical protein